MLEVLDHAPRVVEVEGRISEWKHRNVADTQVGPRLTEPKHFQGLSCEVDADDTASSPVVVGEVLSEPAAALEQEASLLAVFFEQRPQRIDGAKSHGLLEASCLPVLLPLGRAPGNVLAQVHLDHLARPESLESKNVDFKEPMRE